MFFCLYFKLDYFNFIVQHLIYWKLFFIISSLSFVLGSDHFLGCFFLNNYPSWFFSYEIRSLFYLLLFFWQVFKIGVFFMISPFKIKFVSNYALFGWTRLKDFMIFMIVSLWVNLGCLIFVFHCFVKILYWFSLFNIKLFDNWVLRFYLICFEHGHSNITTRLKILQLYLGGLE